jgi:hypothetical protein
MGGGKGRPLHKAQIPPRCEPIVYEMWSLDSLLEG